MKTKLFVTLMALLTIAGINAQAQTASLKIGYTNIDVILGNMPESKQIETELKATQAQYAKLYDAKVKDFQEKLAGYEKLPANTSEVIKADKAKVLEILNCGVIPNIKPPLSSVKFVL